MSRPVKSRASYRTEIDRLGRLRTAILLDRRLTANEVEALKAAIDKIQYTLGPYVTVFPRNRHKDSETSEVEPGE